MAKKVEYKRRVQATIPKNLEEANHFLLIIGYSQREIEKTRATLNDEIDKLKAKARADVGPQEERIAQFVEGLYAFAESHREELTKSGEKKTVELPGGIMAWRTTPPSIVLSDKEEIIINRLKEAHLDRFVRTPREEINKKAMLQEPEEAEKIEGVTVDRHEEFYVKPSEIDIELVSLESKLKRAV